MALALAAGFVLALGVPAVVGLTDWDTTVSYIVDDESGEVSWGGAAGVGPPLACEGGWVSAGTVGGGTTDQREILTIRVSYHRGEVLVYHQDDGSSTTKILFCDDPQPLRDDPTSPTYAVATQDTDVRQQDDTCDGTPDGQVVGLAPINSSVSTDLTAGTEDTRPCLVARAGGTVTADGVPFTGRLHASATNDEGYSVSLTSCTMIAGTCWTDAGFQGWHENATPQWDDTWTLTCETEGLFGTATPAAGSFDCGVWFE